MNIIFYVHQSINVHWYNIEQVDKEAIGLSKVNIATFKNVPLSLLMHHRAFSLLLADLVFACL